MGNIGLALEFSCIFRSDREEGVLHIRTMFHLIIKMHSDISWTRWYHAYIDRNTHPNLRANYAYYKRNNPIEFQRGPGKNEAIVCCSVPYQFLGIQLHIHHTVSVFHLNWRKNNEIVLFLVCGTSRKWTCTTQILMLVRLLWLYCCNLIISVGNSWPQLADKLISFTHFSCFCFFFFSK